MGTVGLKQFLFGNLKEVKEEEGSDAPIIKNLNKQRMIDYLNSILTASKLAPFKNLANQRIYYQIAAAGHKGMIQLTESKDKYCIKDIVLNNGSYCYELRFQFFSELNINHDTIRLIYSDQYDGKNKVCSLKLIVEDKARDYLNTEMEDFITFV